jgi:hypothetical protein
MQDTDSPPTTYEPDGTTHTLDCPCNMCEEFRIAAREQELKEQQRQALTDLKARARKQQQHRANRQALNRLIVQRRPLQ